MTNRMELVGMGHLVDMVDISWYTSWTWTSATRNRFFIFVCLRVRVAAFVPQSSFLRLLAYLQPSTGTAAHATSSSSSVAGARRRTWVHEVAAPTAPPTCYLQLCFTHYSLLTTRHSPLTPSHEAKIFVLSGACGAATTRQFIMSSSSRMTCRRQRSSRSCISAE